MTRVAWIGLGAMGSRMARRHVDAGHDVVVWNRTRSRTELLTAAGAHVARSPAAAAQGAEVVFVMVADPAALREVVLGESGLAAGLGDGTIVVDASTVGVRGSRRLEEMLAGRSDLVDAPVLGSLVEAEEGNLVFFVGGPSTAVAQVSPLIAELGEVMHVGGSGSGAAAKLVANFALMSSVGVLAEALRFADAVGLSRDVTWEVLARSPLAAQAARRRSSVESQSFPPRFRLALAAKDSELIRDEVGGRDDEFPFAAALAAALGAASAAGLGERDYTAVLSSDLVLAETDRGSPGEA